MVPVPVRETRCNFGCCVRKHLPLALAHGKTAHTFQGQTVGPVPPGRPTNPIKKIVIDPRTKDFEERASVGFSYVTRKT